MLSEAIREELIERNVATVVRAASVERVEVQPWSTEEASRFLATAADHRLHALFAVGVALGLRKGELLALRWDDVDLEGGVLHVRQNVQRLPEMGLVFGPPKSYKSRRTIPLPAASAKVLRTHRANQAAEALARGPAWIDSGLVFTSTVGTVIEPRNLNRFFDELIAKTRSPHSLVESARGAVPVLPPVRFPRPLAEPAVPISRQRALHGVCRQAGFVGARGGDLVAPVGVAGDRHAFEPEVLDPVRRDQPPPVGGGQVAAELSPVPAVAGPQHLGHLHQAKLSSLLKVYFATACLK